MDGKEAAKLPAKKNKKRKEEEEKMTRRIRAAWRSVKPRHREKQKAPSCLRQRERKERNSKAALQRVSNQRRREPRGRLAVRTENRGRWADRALKHSPLSVKSFQTYILFLF
ncbi:hypothetical protein ACFX15_012245 [Malus domestica]